MRWVGSADEKQYTNETTKKVFKEFQSLVSEQFGEHLV
jgi:hypothetical protein